MHENKIVGQKRVLLDICLVLKGLRGRKCSFTTHRLRRRIGVARAADFSPGGSNNGLDVKKNSKNIKFSEIFLDLRNFLRKSSKINQIYLKLHEKYKKTIFFMKIATSEPINLT